VSNIKIRELSQQSQRRKESLLGRVINQLKITSIPWKGTDVSKGFDPFSLSWEVELSNERVVHVHELLRRITPVCYK